MDKSFKEFDRLERKLTKLGIRWVDTDKTVWNIANNIDAEDAIKSYITTREQSLITEIKEWAEKEKITKEDIKKDYGLEIVLDVDSFNLALDSLILYLSNIEMK